MSTEDIVKSAPCLHGSAFEDKGRETVTGCQVPEGPCAEAVEFSNVMLAFAYADDTGIADHLAQRGKIAVIVVVSIGVDWNRAIPSPSAKRGESVITRHDGPSQPAFLHARHSATVSRHTPVGSQPRRSCAAVDSKAAANG